MTYIKICGITNRDDALAAVEFGADALGFIAVRESPRFVAATDFRRIREVLPLDFPLVVVAKRPHDAARYNAPFLQYYHEDEIDEGIFLSSRRLRVYRIRDEEDVEAAKNPPDNIDAVVLDSFHIANLGGSGTRFEWELAMSLQHGAAKPFIVAGGLTPRNVTTALERLRPYGVDVSSGVEDELPGNKCRESMYRFIHSIRAWDAEQGMVNKGPFLGGLPVIL